MNKRKDKTINAIDIAVLIVIGASVVIAITRGFTTEALSLVAWVAAIIVTLQGHPYLYPIIVDFVQPDFMASMITYAALGIFSLIIFKFIAVMVGKMIKESHIGALDRGLGALFGMLRGMLIVSFLYLLTTPFYSPGNYPEWFEEAKSRPLIEYGASVINALNPYKDDIDFEERRKDMEALDRLKDMVPSFPTESGDAGYEQKNRDELDKLIKESSNT
ncbi:CvpA family protein [Pseudemcibacter aquimaris]|uniref:CvpA family protein n=1 Tax=Pseudemcibacter aquimaris TaxID=2857064 RepID=UPI002012A7AB|nr:CvpA family protein [Pseudemcibacter aquimaris]MCC3859989.1 CvpA family protein [Pseudemcibacter aquimaris]WDU57320.1 CvpA family protein [Pseudemcibacter aquimaris]